MSFSNLSTEIILLIPPLLPKKDVSSLSRTCRDLRSLTLKEVYRVINGEFDSLPIELLLRSLMDKHELGALVEQFVVSLHNLKTPTNKLKLTAGELSTAMRWVQHFGLTLPELWNAALQRGNTAAYTALTLAFLPNLRSLNLSYHFVSGGQFLGSLFKQAFHLATGGSPLGKVPQYAQLHNAQIGVLHENTTHFRDIYPVFYLPSVKLLSINLGCADDFNWPSAMLQRPRLESLSSLRLPCCDANEDALERLLSTKPPLKELLYGYWNVGEGEKRMDRPLNLDTLSCALNHVCTSLEVLKLQIQLHPDAEALESDNVTVFEGSLDPFEPFGRLVLLELPFAVLSNSNDLFSQPSWAQSSAFPRSLRHLGLRYGLLELLVYKQKPNPLVKYVRDLLANREASGGEILPELQRVDSSLSDNMTLGAEVDEEYKRVCVRYQVQGSVLKSKDG